VYLVYFVLKPLEKNVTYFKGVMNWEIKRSLNFWHLRGHHIVMTWKSALAAGCIMGNCLLRVDLCVITASSLSFCYSKVMTVNVQIDQMFLVHLLPNVKICPSPSWREMCKAIGPCLSSSFCI